MTRRHVRCVSRDPTNGGAEEKARDHERRSPWLLARSSDACQAALRHNFKGEGMGVIGSAQILLPLIITDIDPANREINLGYVAGEAAFFSAVGGPVGGALSDRTTLRFGRRRPWMLAASVASAGALAALSRMESILALMALWSLVGFANSAVLTAARAFIPAQVPEGQRDRASAFSSKSTAGRRRNFSSPTRSGCARRSR